MRAFARYFGAFWWWKNQGFILEFDRRLLRDSVTLGRYPSENHLIVTSFCVSNTNLMCRSSLKTEFRFLKMKKHSLLSVKKKMIIGIVLHRNAAQFIHHSDIWHTHHRKVSRSRFELILRISCTSAFQDLCPCLGVICMFRWITILRRSKWRKAS